jgi:hypothetical protein
MQATCKRFYEYCSEHGIALPRHNFRLKYDTNIPRQVSLMGSWGGADGFSGVGKEGKEAFRKYLTHVSPV